MAVEKKEIKETKQEAEKIASKKDNLSNTKAEQHETNKEVVGAPIFVKKKSPFADYKLFNKWSFDEVVVTDPSLMKYINLDPVIIPHSFGRKSQGRFAKININVVERLINKSMRSGQGKRKLSGKFMRGRNGCGKKLQTMQIVEDAFAIVAEKSKENPIQMLVRAVENSAPREDVTRVRRGGVIYSLAVDVSPMKRLDEAIKNIALAGFGNSYRSRTEASEALAEEIISAAANDNKSLAIKRRDEVERVAKASR
ncbi:MAG: 30S ribosomal protein S7 [Candidatus ainarchaeum sp.]|nr:30S ribosomal protein S7 [Candidatus ainarchaeum sp.]